MWSRHIFLHDVPIHDERSSLVSFCEGFSLALGESENELSRRSEQAEHVAVQRHIGHGCAFAFYLGCVARSFSYNATLSAGGFSGSFFSVICTPRPLRFRW